jgi:GT2 family glycosyltransferase
MGKVFILLPVHDRRETTRRFAECLAAQKLKTHQLVLLDDGSTDGTADAVRALVPNAVVLTGTGDWWWGGALQRGYQWVRAQELSANDVVVTINDDTELPPEFLETGCAILRARPRTLLQAYAVDLHTGALVDGGAHVDWRRLSITAAASPAEVNCLSTNGLFLRATDFVALGGFRPRRLPHYLSDYEFTLRAAREGFALLVDPSLRLRTDTAKSGFRDFSKLPFREFLARYFSIRSTMDPRTWTAFVALACPWPWKAWHFVTVWRIAAAAVVGAALRAVWPRRS